jgi:hypothetical protein
MKTTLSEIIDEETQETVTEVSKSQNIRLIDVFVLAPIMVYAGTFKSLPTWVRISLIGMGVATAFYNGKKFLENRKNLQKNKII